MPMRLKNEHFCITFIQEADLNKRLLTRNMETENATIAVKTKMCVDMTAVSFIISTISVALRQIQFRIALKQ